MTGIRMNQIKIDFEYDDRIERLASEFGIMIIPHLAPGTGREFVKTLAGRLAMLAAQRLKRYDEPTDPILCHTCDAPTKPNDRVRVAVCVRCATQGSSPGSDG